MTTTKTTIERADEIVGIDKTLTVCMREGGSFVADTYRRGAYVEWFAKNSSQDMWPTVAEFLYSQAERIVLLHAASKPKGDGLPEVTEVHTWTSYSGGGKEFSFSFVPPVTDDKSATAMHDYIARCLSSATRRFLAAFECFDPTSDEKCSGEAFVVTTTTAACVAGPNGPVCWLKPRETK